VHIPSSVDIVLGTLPPIHGEPKLPNRFGESTRIFTRDTSIALVLTFSTILIFETQTGEMHLNYPLLILLLIFEIVSDDDPLISLRKEKRTCTSHHVSRFVSYSHKSSSFHAFISSLDS